MAQSARPGGLLHDVSRAVFWNTALLPVVTAAGMLLSILVRRSFGLESGIYDVVLGITNSILFYSSLGLAGSLPKFLPELQVRAGRRAAAHLIWRLGSVRIGMVIAILIPMNLWARPIAEALNLGADGTIYLRWISVLLLGRAALDFLYRALDSFLQQLSVNGLALLNGIIDLCFVGAVVAIGSQMAGVIGALGISAAVTAIVAFFVVLKQLRRLPAPPYDSPAAAPPVGRIWKMSGVTYARDLSLYFATPAFASPVLLAVFGRPEPVALFATAYFVAASTVTLVVSGFRGIYRPAFARVLAAGERAQLRRSFDLMNKVQIVAVVPAGFGLAVMVDDYLPLLYGEAFASRRSSRPCPHRTLVCGDRARRRLDCPVGRRAVSSSVERAARDGGRGPVVCVVRRAIWSGRSGVRARQRPRGVGHHRLHRCASNVRRPVPMGVCSESHDRIHRDGGDSGRTSPTLAHVDRRSDNVDARGCCDGDVRSSRVPDPWSRRARCAQAREHSRKAPAGAVARPAGDHVKVLKSMVRATFFTPIRRLRKRARHARRQRDEKVLLDHVPLTVRTGPFAGMNLEGTCSPIGPKVLGTYEMELSSLIETIARSPVRHVVNVGAADGFYAVGLLRHLPMARATAFEMRTSLHPHIDTLARTNGVRDRLTIHGVCDSPTLSSTLNHDERTLVIMDVEGAERELLDVARVPGLRHAHILVEAHDFVDPQISGLIRQRFEATHRVTVYRSRLRELADLPGVGGIGDAMLRRLANEGRPAQMEWFWLEPHASAR